MANHSIKLTIYFFSEELITAAVLGVFEGLISEVTSLTILLPVAAGHQAMQTFRRELLLCVS
jgi:Mg/Co/Ni transporter MgtE